MLPWKPKFCLKVKLLVKEMLIQHEYRHLEDFKDFFFFRCLISLMKQLKIICTVSALGQGLFSVSIRADKIKE